MATNNGEIRITLSENHTGVSQQYVDGKVAQEATARQEADSALRSELTALVEQEATARQNAITAETTAREASEALIRSYVDAKTAGALHYKGTVATVANLPQTGQVTGDMYNVQADGQNYAWDGSRWDSMGALIDLDPLWAGINANRTAISEEVMNRQSAVSDVQNNLNAEITNRQAAVSGVHNEVVAETNRATVAESALQTSISEEATNRQADVENLESQISAKTSAEIAADFEDVKSKLNAVADRTETGGYWVFAFTDANGNVTFGQTIIGDLINGIAI